MPRATRDLETIRSDVLGARGTVQLQLGTEDEWNLDFEADCNGQTFRGLLGKTGAAEKIEQLRRRQAEKGKSIEGIVVHVKSVGAGRPKKFDSLSEAYDYVLQPGDRIKVTFMIGTNY